jgi:hypothetical protein
MAILCILTVLTVILMFYLPSHRSILREEPRGILGSADLLYGSNVFTLLLDPANRTPNYDGRFYEWLDRHYLLGLEKCSVVDDGGRIEVENLVPKLSPELRTNEGRTARRVSNEQASVVSCPW